MGTKNNPGQYDCYANAEGDEPMFVLLGRDRHAPHLVREWAWLRRARGEDPAKVTEALRCADAMEAFRRRRDADASGLLAFEIDCDGVAYYVAAPTARAAFGVLFELWDRSGEEHDLAPILSAEIVAKERARKIRIRRGGEPGDDCLSDLVYEAVAPAVLGCSEW